MSNKADTVPELEPHEARLVEAIRRWLALPPADRPDVLHDAEQVEEVVTRLRAARGGHKLPDRLIAALDTIPGWCWTWNQEQSVPYVEAVERFVQTNGIENLVASTVSDGLAIGRWLNSQRHNYRIGKVSKWLRARLEQLPGWTAKRGLEVGRAHRTRETMGKHLEALRAHVRTGALITKLDTGERGGSFYSIHNFFVKRKERGELPDDLRQELEAIPGWYWVHHGEERDREMIGALKATAARGDALHFGLDAEIDGVKVGNWIRTCNTRRRLARLPEWLRQELEALPGWKWTVDRNTRVWRTLELLRQVLTRITLDDLPQDPIHDGVDLLSRIRWFRTRYRRGSLPSEMVAELEKLPGWCWNPRIEQSRVFASRPPSDRPAAGSSDTPFDRRGKPTTRRGVTTLEAEYLRLITGYLATGARSLASKSAMFEGVGLRQPVAEFRRQHADGLMSPDLAVQLEASPGWTWSPVEERFERNFHAVRQFIAEHGIDALTGGVVIDGEAIGRWLSIQRQQYQRHRLAPRWRTLFEQLPGWKGRKGRAGLGRFQSRQTISRHLEALEAHARGERPVSPKKLVYIRLYFYKLIAKHKLTPLERSRFDANAGAPLATDIDVKKRYLGLLRKLAGEQGLPDVTSGVVVERQAVGTWAMKCCKRYREGRLEEWLIRELESIPGWLWKPSRAESRARKLALLEKYLTDHDLADLYNHPIVEGINLYNVVHGKKRAYNNGTLPDDEIRFLERLPFWSWSPRDDDRARPRWKRSDPIQIQDEVDVSAEEESEDIDEVRDAES